MGVNLGEIIRDWGVACAKRRAECLIKLVSKTVPNISTASGGGRLATDYNKFTRRCRMAAQTARRLAASYFGPTESRPPASASPRRARENASERGASAFTRRRGLMRSVAPRAAPPDRRRSRVGMNMPWQL